MVTRFLTGEVQTHIQRKRDSLVQSIRRRASSILANSERRNNIRSQREPCDIEEATPISLNTIESSSMAAIEFPNLLPGLAFISPKKSYSNPTLQEKQDSIRRSRSSKIFNQASRSTHPPILGKNCKQSLSTPSFSPPFSSKE